MLRKQGRGFTVRSAGIVGALAMVYGGMAQGASLSADQENELRTQIIEQTKRLESLRQRMAEEEAKLAEIRQALGIDVLRGLRGGTGTPAAVQAGNQQPVQMAQAAGPAASGGSGERPAQDTKTAAVAQIFEQPGILTPRGKLVVEPGLQYGYSSSNRVSLVGYTIIPALHIGLIDVREVKRNTFTASITGRYGITNRFEIEAKLPYVYRSDSVLSRPWQTGGASDQLLESSGHGIGDFEVTGRYQLNDGGIDKPYYVGSLRFKSRTGKDPFEVETVAGTNAAQQQLQKELPTGSGFYTLQPGLTVLYPTDPAVFFGGINYQYNFKRSNLSFKNDDGTTTPVGEIKPGDVIGFNFGMGLSLNDRSSFSIGYDHASVGRLRQNGSVAPNSVRTQLGTLLIGYSQRINPTTSLNVSLGAGITRDTPDLTLTLRLPMTF
ncbi:MAG TPA: acetate kinase [Rhodocyclaceae bacterium]|nr:acetate kinase [Rhodocyclaceae bacterium]